MGEQLVIPGTEADKPVDEPLAEGMAWFVLPGGGRAQGRPKCIVRGREIDACFALERLLGWFSPNSRTRLYIGAVMRRAKKGERAALIIEHGARAADLGWCPCCGVMIRTAFAEESSS